jgi:hypothetical protein
MLTTPERFMRRVVAGLLAALPSMALSQIPSTRRETVQVLESRSIPRDIADDVSRVFNATETLRLNGVQVIDTGTVVASDIGIIDGTLEIRGHVTGRVVGINAEIVVRPTARLDRDVTVLGGRFDNRQGIVAGDVRVYRDQVQVDYETDRIVVHEQTDGQEWYRRRERAAGSGWGTLRFLSTRTYNRVEGLPLLIGPAFSRTLGWGRLSAEAMGILRSADNFEWSSENRGHTAKVELTVGKHRGFRVGGRLFDIVDAVEPWHLGDSEVGLASFLIHRDYRDYFDRHGASISGALFRGTSADLTVTYSDQRWGSRDTRSPFTLFRRDQDWRPNPQLDEGRFHVVNTILRYDTRNDQSEPWSGWYVIGDYEFGSGDISRLAPSSPLVRPTASVGRIMYDRGFLDIRRYNRVSPGGQLNLRLVAAGWLSGDELPLERRFSVGGPGTLPGFDFRRVRGRIDYWQCSGPLSGGLNVQPSYPAGLPAQCERMALAQAEYRGEIHVDPFGLLNEERARRRHGWGRSAEWVVFADAGRGWLVGERLGNIQYNRTAIPAFGTFRTDMGVGLRLDDLGLYVAKALSNPNAPLNFFVRLRPRF